MEENPPVTLTPDTDRYTLLDLLRLAAAHTGLKLQAGASRACSKPFAEVTLDDRLLAFLAERNIKRQPRPDHPGIFTLVDENHQVRIPGWAPSNYWNFKPREGTKHEFDLRVKLAVGFAFNARERGVEFWPMTHGSFLSPTDPLPNYRLFRAIVESGKADVPPIVREIAQVPEEVGRVVVRWADLGLAGVKRVRDLFAEFVGKNDTVLKIAQRGELFYPPPHPRHQQPGDELFIVEPAQPQILRAWLIQLEEYRNSLAI